MTRKLDLNLLLALDALMTERNVTRAAARLQTSQPALSAQLVRLRAMFDDPLLVAGSRGMTPTPRALEIAPRLSELIGEFRAIVQPDHFDPLTSEATIQIGSPDALHNGLAASFATWAERAPNIRLAFIPLTRLNKPDIDQRMATGQLDLLLTVLSMMPERLHTRHVSTESFVCALRGDHPFNKRVMSMEDLCALTHVIVSPMGGSFVGDIDAALAEHGMARKVVASVPSFMLATNILYESDFAAVFPRTLALSLGSTLKLFELPVSIPTGKIAVGWHERTHRSPPHKWFREQLIDVFLQRKRADEPAKVIPGARIRPR
ncbi:LysR family transcriptional regulator [Pigmentiphaga litoralis]|uniref:LysR family transcriptional regulator n=1 Tax=Pigmentiphaga litoralis TaxID=516702 RepID=UPI003B42CFF7